MAQVNGVVQGGPFDGQTVVINIPSVRIPELNENAPPLELTDELAIYDKSENLTSKATLAVLRELMITGGAAVGIPPVLVGDRYEIVVTPVNIAGADPVAPNRVTVTELMGKTYTLRRTGYGDLIVEDWLNLPSGGFELTDDTVRLGEIFIATVYSVGTAPASSNAASGFLDGIAILQDDTTLNSVHRYKSLHAAPTVKNIVITLENISSIPDNLIIPIETTLTGTYKVKIQTQSGQNIYYNNSAVQNIWLGANEFIWLMRGTDGFYVIHASESITNVGQPFFDYIKRPNSLEALGQLVYRSEEPRLFDFISTHAEMVASEAEWNNPGDHVKGRFTLGTITSGPSANFRVPDFQNQFFRGLNNVGGTDTQRPINLPGYTQDDELKAHSHTFDLKENGSGNSQDFPAITDNKFIPKGTGTTSIVGGTETRGKNVGFVPYIKT